MRIKKELIISMIFLFTVPVMSQTNVSGDVSGTWSTVNDPYYVQGDITVQTGQTLTIQSGVEVRFQGNYQFYIYGSLSASGVEGDSIYFVQDLPSNDRWGGIKFRLADDASNLSYCRIENGHARNGGNEDYGGAVRISGCSPTIEHCLIINNYAEQGGGGIFIHDASRSLVEFCIIKQDSSRRGGGIQISGSSPIIRNNIISDNMAGDGGGVYFTAVLDSIVFQYNTIMNNTATPNYGGGLYFESVTNLVEIDRNKIINNNGSFGGGIYLNTNQSRLNIVNNLIYNNSSTFDGGAIASAHPDSTNLINNTIYSNSARRGGAIYSFNGGNPHILNSILWNNTASQEGNEIYVNLITSPPGEIVVEYSNIEGGYTGTGNINSNPLFADAGNADFHYEQNSPVVDAGTNVGAPAFDYDGNTRPFDGNRDLTATVDIGAFEYQNTAPQITSTAVTSAKEDALYSYQLDVLDDDVNEVISYSFIEAPAFLGVNGSGLLSGTPLNGDVGDHDVTVQVEDLNGATDTQTFSISVANTNDAPTVATPIGDQTATEDATFNFTFSASAFTDVDVGDNLSYSATLADNSDLPTWLNFTPGSRNFGGMPANADVGTITIKVTATDDSSATVSDEFELEVQNDNDAPVVSDIPDQEIAEGATFATITLDNYVTDIDADNDPADMTWTYSGNTDLSIAIDETTHVATISIPNVNWTGSEIITFEATDPGGMSDSDPATFTVTAINDAPVVSNIPGQSITEGNTFTSINLNNYVSDVDNSKSQLTWSYSGATDLTINITDSIATITAPDLNWNGSETITFTATDPGDLFDSDDATFTVTAVNDAPVVGNIPDQTIDEGLTFATINLDNYVSDVDNNASEMTWISSGNSELSVDIVGRVATITIPDTNWNGEETITFEASDPGGLFDSDPATFKVTAVNDAPVVGDIPGQSIAEGGSFTTINLNNYVSDVDNSNSQMTWTYSENSQLIVNIADSIATISTPNVNWNGSETITFTATDPGGLSNGDAAIFNVSSENDPPIVSGIPDQEIEEGSTFATINLDDYVTDADHADSQMSWTYSGNSQLTVSITNRVATITIPNVNWNGSETITFTAQDPGGLSNSDAADFTVTAVNDAPVVSDIPAQTIAEGANFTNIPLDNYVADVDNADNQITWSYSGNTELTVSINETSRVATVSVPSAEWNGSEIITFTATDPGDLFDSDTVAFKVTSVNDAPVVSDIPDQTVDEGGSFTNINLSNYVSDVDNGKNELSWSYSGNTELTVGITDSIATISIPDANWNGSEEITFTATDPGTLSGSDAVTFTVNAINDAPVIGDIPDRTIKEGNSFANINLDSYITDVDNADSEMTWTFSGNNHLTVAVDTNRIMHVVPENPDWNGSEKIFITATDPGTLSATDSAIFTITPVNDAPVIANLPEEITFENDSTVIISLDGLASDVDSPLPSLVWSFSTSNDSVHADYDSESNRVSISAPGFIGDVEIYGTVTDDSMASDTDTILVHVELVTGIEDLYSNLPTKYELQQNFPNPFNPTTKIRFGLPQAANLTLEVYNIVGQKVATVFEGHKAAGYHVVEFDASSLASGIYFYRIQAGRYIAIKKMILIK